MGKLALADADQAYLRSVNARSEQDHLRKNWWPVAYTTEVKKDEPYSVSLFGEPLVLFWNEANQIECLHDLCPHKSVPLSLGYVERGSLVCRYHGWSFGAGGRCHKPTALAGRASAAVPSYKTVNDGLIIWVYPDESDPVAFINPLSAYSSEAGLALTHFTTRTFVFDHPWEFWAASFVDGNHHQHAHANTFLPVQRDSLNFVFNAAVSPAAMAVYGKHDKWVGVFAYLLFCPTHEGAHKQFLTLLPTSEVLSPSLSYAAFRLLRLPELLYNVVYEDYCIIENQYRRVCQGAPKWGIGGKYDTAVTRDFVAWHRRHERDPVWFKQFSGPNRRLGPPEPVAKIHATTGNDCGKTLAPFRWQHLIKKPHDDLPATWRKLSPYQRLIKFLLHRFAKALTANA